MIADAKPVINIPRSSRNSNQRSFEPNSVSRAFPKAGYSETNTLRHWARIVFCSSIVFAIGFGSAAADFHEMLRECEHPTEKAPKETGEEESKVDVLVSPRLNRRHADRSTKQRHIVFILRAPGGADGQSVSKLARRVLLVCVHDFQNAHGGPLRC